MSNKRCSKDNDICDKKTHMCNFKTGRCIKKIGKIGKNIAIEKLKIESDSYQKKINERLQLDKDIDKMFSFVDKKEENEEDTEEYGETEQEQQEWIQTALKNYTKENKENEYEEEENMEDVYKEIHQLQQEEKTYIENRIKKEKQQKIEQEIDRKKREINKEETKKKQEKYQQKLYEIALNIPITKLFSDKTEFIEYQLNKDYEIQKKIYEKEKEKKEIREKYIKQKEKKEKNKKEYREEHGIFGDKPLKKETLVLKPHKKVVRTRNKTKSEIIIKPKGDNIHQFVLTEETEDEKENKESEDENISITEINKILEKRDIREKLEPITEEVKEDKFIEVKDKKLINKKEMEKKQKQEIIKQILEQKTEIKEDKLKYTEICKSVFYKQKCKHMKCRFAHTIYDYNPVKCRFDPKCYVGTSCKFIHSNETKLEMLKRLNYLKYF
jgi:hypothetical protein